LGKLDLEPKNFGPEFPVDFCSGLYNPKRVPFWNYENGPNIFVAIFDIDKYLNFRALNKI
jgi:hypothetical protein